MKNEIKMLLNLGINMSVDYKSKIDEWYSKKEIYKYKDRFIVSSPHITFYNIDEAVNYFILETFSSKNKGYIQNRLFNKNLLSDEIDFEDPSQKTLELFKKEGELVDAELEKLNIKIKLPTYQEALEEFKKVEKIADLDKVKTHLEKLKKDFSTLDLHVNVILKYFYLKDGEEKINKSFIDIDKLDKNKLKKIKDAYIKSEHFKNFQRMEIDIKISDINFKNQYDINNLKWILK